MIVFLKICCLAGAIAVICYAMRNRKIRPGSGTTRKHRFTQQTLEILPAPKRSAPGQPTRTPSAWSRSGQRGPQRTQADRKGVLLAAEACWQNFLALRSAERTYDTCRKLFYRNGLLYYAQRYAGFIEALPAIEALEQAKETLRYDIANGFRNLLLVHCRLSDGHFVLRTEYPPEMEREAYFRQLGLRPDTPPDSGLEQTLRTKADQLSKELLSQHNASDNCLLSNLWIKLRPHCERLFAFEKDELDALRDLSELRAFATSHFEALLAELRGGGFEFRFARDCTPAEIEDDFLDSEDDEELPSVIRTSDHYVFQKGRHRTHATC